MVAVTFDTLQFVQRLKKAGIDEPQAEAIAEAMRDVQENADVATKQDIADIRRDITEMATKRDIAETKAELVKWVVSVGVLQTVIIAALLMRLMPA